MYFAGSAILNPPSNSLIKPHLGLISKLSYNKGKTKEIHLMEAEGSHQPRLTDNHAIDISPSWWSGD
jgi:hypothetical protein